MKTPHGVEDENHFFMRITWFDAEYNSVYI